MDISCPNCGAEVKKEFKFCLSCGYDFQTTEPKGVASEENQAAQSKTTSTTTETQPVGSVSNVPPPQQSTSQQNYEQIQTNSQVRPKKTNIKILGVLITIIAIVVIVIVILLMTNVFGSGAAGLEGTWQTTMSYGDTEMSFTMILNSDKTIEMGTIGFTIPIGTWEEKNNELCLQTSDSSTFPGMEMNGGIQCIPYTLSGNKMIWDFGAYTYTWTKV